MVLYMFVDFVSKDTFHTQSGYKTCKGHVYLTDCIITEDFQEKVRGPGTRRMEKGMMSVMSSLVYDWLVSASA